MGKPLGLALTLGESGIGMHVTQSNRLIDKIWDVAEDAHGAGWTAQKFILEARDAWEHAIEEDAKRQKEEIAAAAPAKKPTWM